MIYAINERLSSLDEEPPLPFSVSQEKHKESSRPYRFRKQFFTSTTAKQWNDWNWQLFHRITTFQQLYRFLIPTEQEQEALEHPSHHFPFSITPYYLSLIDLSNPDDPLRKCVIPRSDEMRVTEGEMVDPLSEDQTTPVRGIVHRYPDRALFLVTHTCSVYCRYCTRSRLVGGHSDVMGNYWEEAFQYLHQHKEIRDVIISGGDPLMLSDDLIALLLERLKEIKHIEIIRIGTKIPFVLPQRITPSLIKILKRYRPLYINIHATHPNEISEASRHACNRLSDAGIVLSSQTVLLKGVNDSTETMTELFHKLLTIRVRPYYLFQCDPIVGSHHFRTTIEKGKEIMEGLRGYTSGLAIPYYVVDTPLGGGKVPVLPHYEVSHDHSGYHLKNYEGNIYTYPDCKEG
ncbi:MAG: KamA family radical SAM protein [Sphaerochaetaceae bacterium]